MTTEFAAKEKLEIVLSALVQGEAGEGTAMKKLRLVESKTLDSGTLALIYQPANK